MSFLKKKIFKRHIFLIQNSLVVAAALPRPHIKLKYNDLSSIITLLFIESIILKSIYHFTMFAQNSFII